MALRCDLVVPDCSLVTQTGYRSEVPCIYVRSELDAVPKRLDGQPTRSEQASHDAARVRVKLPANFLAVRAACPYCYHGYLGRQT